MKFNATDDKLADWSEPALNAKTGKHASLGRLACGSLGAAALALTINTASAQTAANADTVYDGYLAAYLVTEQPPGGYNYTLPYLRGSTTNVKKFAMWEEAFCITAIEDAYDSTVSNSRRELVGQLLTAFLGQHGTPVDSGWNDDIEWAARALAHGYQITGDTACLNAAIANWNKVWDRGWNSDLGGGILEKQDESVKCVLSNAPFIITGCMLYSSTGDSVYLDRSKQTYSWMRANCFYPSTGQVIEGVGTTGPRVSDNIYNHGSFVQAANALYQLTGDQQYYNDALAAIEHIRSEHYIFTTDNGCEEFVRGLSLFARMNGLWDTYYPWLKANAQAAWDHRRTDYNITWPDWTQDSPIENLKSMKAIGSLVIQQVTVIRPLGQSELKNAASSLSLNVEGNSTADGAKIVQWPYEGATNSLWTFTHHSDSGYCQMVSVRSGKDVAVQSASTANGAKIIQYTHGSSSNDLWVPALTIRGNYSFVNKRSGKYLEDPGLSTAQGTQMDQWGYSGGREQRWQMIRH